MEGTNWVFNNDVFDGTPQINEGYLYKKGKIVRNWKLRWSVMDTEKGEVSWMDVVIVSSMNDLILVIILMSLQLYSTVKIFILSKDPIRANK